MTNYTPLKANGPCAAAVLATMLLPLAVQAEADICTECVQVRMGTPEVVRGPFPDELDATFSALKLPDGTFRGFSANGATYAIDGASISDMGGPRKAVLEPGARGSLAECGRWLTSAVPLAERIVGFVHQERACDYDVGRTDKTMAIASSTDSGMTWTDLGTVISGIDSPQPDRITGEGDCSLVNAEDGFLYAYCLRNSDWQTIVARAPVADLANWRKYHLGDWNEPGLKGAATDIGFVGTGAGFLKAHKWVIAVATDPWFGGLRLSLSSDKVAFADLASPLVPIDGAEWNRPASTDLIAYAGIANPKDGSNTVDDDLLLTYIFVPAGKGFESRYLVQQPMSLMVAEAPVEVASMLALTRWRGVGQDQWITTTGAVLPESGPVQVDQVVAYMLTRAPSDVDSVRIEDCGGAEPENLQQLAKEGECGSQYSARRTAGWLLTAAQDGTTPVYSCTAKGGLGHFGSRAADCEGLGQMDQLLGFGIAP